jgi:hypothetical protein
VHVHVEVGYYFPFNFVPLTTNHPPTRRCICKPVALRCPHIAVGIAERRGIADMLDGSSCT